jgi:putative oxidoreductase
MSISRRLARPLLASIFVYGGYDAFRDPDSKVKAADAVTRPLTEKLPMLPQDTATLVKWNGALQMGAGTLLGLGWFRRIAAVALIGSIVPTTYAGHRFWEEADDETRARQRIQLGKNLGLLGGLILAAVDTEGAPSLGWRARHRSRRGSTAGVAELTRAMALSHRASTRASDLTKKEARLAGRAAQRAGHRANEAVVGAATSGLALAAPYARHANEGIVSAAKSALDAADPYLSAGMERASDLLTAATEHLPGR